MSKFQWYKPVIFVFVFIFFKDFFLSLSVLTHCQYFFFYLHMMESFLERTYITLYYKNHHIQIYNQFFLLLSFQYVKNQIKKHMILQDLSSYKQQSGWNEQKITICHLKPIIQEQLLKRNQKQMQALKKLHKALKQDQSIKNIIKMLENYSQNFMTKPPDELSQSMELKMISNQIQHMKLGSIEQAFIQLPSIPQITAIILKSSKQFTLAFLMIPENKFFGWHDHAKMNGISKIVSGDLIIKSLNPQYLQKCAEQDENIFYYPIERIRQQQLKSEGQKISIIYPDSFNIHEIFAKKQSSFLDLLIPEYPDNSCHYFMTCQQPIIQGQTEDKIKIKKLNKSYEEIIGIEKLAKFIKQKQKHKFPPPKV